jgi:heme A synthase
VATNGVQEVVGSNPIGPTAVTPRPVVRWGGAALFADMASGGLVHALYTHCAQVGAVRRAGKRIFPEDSERRFREKDGGSRGCRLEQRTSRRGDQLPLWVR